MKKFLLFAVVSTVLASCGKEEIGEITSCSFEIGQKVTITANTVQTKATSSLDGTTGSVSFKWEAGDQIKVTVGTASANFTLVSGSGETSATFSGTMPASGNTFDVQYPTTDPDITSQSYSSTEAIPHNMMKFTATNCKTGTPFTLTPANAALRLNLYGLDRKVSKIEVINTTPEPDVVYTLTCSTAVKIGTTQSTATPFFVVVPAGNYKISVLVSTDIVSPAEDNTFHYVSGTDYGLGTVVNIASFGTAYNQTYTAGKVKNMPARAITLLCAPVNCGYDADHTYGLLYQWGRKVGSGYNNTEGKQTEADGPVSSPEDDKFYTLSTQTGTWLTDAANVFGTTWPSKSGDAGYLAGKIENPCPEGWRAPTKSEFNALILNKSSFLNGANKVNNQCGIYLSGSTTYSETAPKVFFPANGYIHVQKGVGPFGRDQYGYYWSCNTYTYGHDFSNAITFYDSGQVNFFASSSQGHAYSVRCVKDM